MGTQLRCDQAGVQDNIGPNDHRGRSSGGTGQRDARVWWWTARAREQCRQPLVAMSDDMEPHVRVAGDDAGLHAHIISLQNRKDRKFSFQGKIWAERNLLGAAVSQVNDGPKI